MAHAKEMLSSLSRAQDTCTRALEARSVFAGDARELLDLAGREETSSWLASDGDAHDAIHESGDVPPAVEFA